MTMQVPGTQKPLLAYLSASFISTIIAVWYLNDAHRMDSSITEWLLAVPLYWLVLILLGLPGYFLAKIFVKELKLLFATIIIVAISCSFGLYQLVIFAAKY
jgi:hypothetical protein